MLRIATYAGHVRNGKKNVPSIMASQRALPVYLIGSIVRLKAALVSENVSGIIAVGTEIKSSFTKGCN